MIRKFRKPPTRKEGLLIAKRLKRMLVEAGVKFDAIYLYGSVARDAAHEWSDIDIAVVCERFDRSKVREARALYALFPERDVRMSLVVLHPGEMENKYSTIADEIKKDGVEI